MARLEYFVLFIRNGAAFRIHTPDWSSLFWCWEWYVCSNTVSPGGYLLSIIIFLVLRCPGGSTLLFGLVCRVLWLMRSTHYRRMLVSRQIVGPLAVFWIGFTCYFTSIAILLLDARELGFKVEMAQFLAFETCCGGRFILYTALLPLFLYVNASHCSGAKAFVGRVESEVSFTSLDTASSGCWFFCLSVSFCEPRVSCYFQGPRDTVSDVFRSPRYVYWCVHIFCWLHRPFFSMNVLINLQGGCSRVAGHGLDLVQGKRVWVHFCLFHYQASPFEIQP